MYSEIEYVWLVRFLRKRRRSPEDSVQNGLAAAVVIATAVASAAAAVSAAAEENKKDKYDPKTRVVTTVVTEHKNTPFRRCAGCYFKKYI